MNIRERENAAECDIWRYVVIMIENGSVVPQGLKEKSRINRQRLS